MLSVQHKTVRGASIVWLLLAFGMVGGNADDKAKRMVRTEAEPQYVRNENYPAKWFRVLKKGSIPRAIISATMGRFVFTSSVRNRMS